MSRFKPQEDYAERMHKQGCTKVSTWVPEHLRQELLDIAEDMRKENAAESKKRSNVQKGLFDE